MNLEHRLQAILGYADDITRRNPERRDEMINPNQKEMLLDFKALQIIYWMFQESRAKL